MNMVDLYLVPAYRDIIYCVEGRILTNGLHSAVLSLPLPFKGP